MILHEVTIMDTMEMVETFERAVGYQLCPEDRLEIFHQLFLILAQNTPLDLDDRNVLDYDSLIFANHLNVNKEAVDQAAYNLMVKLWNDLQGRGFYVNGVLDYFPFAMVGWDLSVRHYKS
jgi:hypothetical protein